MERKQIELNLEPAPVRFTSTGYLSSFAIPDVFFHVTTADNTLRHNSLAIGKRDFLGEV